jgi:hypothetical protein
MRFTARAEDGECPEYQHGDQSRRRTERTAVMMSGPSGHIRPTYLAFFSAPLWAQGQQHLMCIGTNAKIQQKSFANTENYFLWVCAMVR